MTAITPEAEDVAESPPHADRIEIIEHLRGLAALSVAWFHFTQGGALSTEGWLKASGAYAWLGFEVFFVISGFVIPYSMSRIDYAIRDHWGTFVLRRLVRLEPPYIAAIAIALALLYAASSVPGFRGPSPNVELSSLLLHIGYLNDLAGAPWLVLVFWSLAIEFQFYLFLSVAYPLIARGSPSRLLLALVAFCALATLFPSKVLLFHYAPLFALGIATFWRLTRRVSDPLFVLAWGLSMAALAATQAAEVAVAGGVTALCIAYIRAPRFHGLTLLGAMSYSLYLVHLPVGSRVVNLGARFVDSAAGKLLIVLLALGFSLLVAWLLYRIVERPAKAWSARLKYCRFPLKSAG